MKNISGKKSRRSMNAFRNGVKAEAFAAFLLALKGYRVLGKRLRTPFGEVDILAQKGAALVVVEVKTRGNVADSHAAISLDQQQRLLNAGQHLSARYGKNISSIRCDAFLFGGKAWPRHIKNAFGG